MRYLLVLGFLISSSSLFSQQIDYNQQKGYVAGGYDVVSYFSNKVAKGSSSFQYRYDGADYKFSSKQNLETFKANPNKYIPQYGGWCAYAIADKGKKIKVNPKTFEIRNDKLYLLYNSLGTNTLKLWDQEGAANLQKQADKNWEKVKYKL